MMITNPLPESMMHWTSTAVDCYNLQQDCSQCVCSTTYGFHKKPNWKQRRCHMPLLIKNLLERKGPPTGGKNDSV